MKIFKFILFVSSIVYGIELGVIPQTIDIDDGLIELETKKRWSNEQFQLKSQGYILFYVDPDEESKNRHAEAMIDEAFRDYPDYYKNSITIINIKATWKPDFLLMPFVKQRQKKYPYNTFVIDYNKTLVKKWGLEDNAYHIIIVSNDGKIIYSNYNKLTKSDIDEVIKILKRQIIVFLPHSSRKSKGVW